MDAICVSAVSKVFRVPNGHRQGTLKESLIRRLTFQNTQGSSKLQALRDVTFSVKHGQTLGIIGSNGSGKTTLLRLLAGVFSPSEGAIQIDGAVAPLLALGVGFHPDLTGRENIRIDALLLGLSPRDVDERMDGIVAFAELEDFIDAPLRSYSSGMIMRLAFAVAVCVDPDVLLLDEVLAVGDEAFGRKCLRSITEFRNKGKTIVLVTHDGRAVVEWCDVAIWLDHGRIRMFGNPKEVVDAYYIDSLTPVERAQFSALHA